MSCPRTTKRSPGGCSDRRHRWLASWLLSQVTSARVGTSSCPVTFLVMVQFLLPYMLSCGPCWIDITGSHSWGPNSCTKVSATKLTAWETKVRFPNSHSHEVPSASNYCKGNLNYPDTNQAFPCYPASPLPVTRKILGGPLYFWFCLCLLTKLFVNGFMNPIGSVHPSEHFFYWMEWSVIIIIGDKRLKAGYGGVYNPSTLGHRVKSSRAAWVHMALSLKKKTAKQTKKRK